ncbi:MAG: hypothetical protein ACPGTP_00085 [Bacteroidia bacterium]
MRNWVVWVVLIPWSLVLGQEVKVVDLIGKHFYVTGFESPLPLYLEKGDTIDLKNGVKFESLYFSKKDKLKKVANWQWCGSTTFLERMFNRVKGQVTYFKEFNGTYKLDQESQSLILSLGRDSYHCKILNVTYVNNEIDVIELVVRQKNPRQDMLRR